MNSPTLSSSPARRLITVLFIGQGLALIALFTTAAIGSISGVQLAGTERVAGWPSTAQLLGGTVAAYIAGRVMNRFGRRIGLSIGYIAGIAGGLVAGLAMIAGNFALFLGGMLLLGAGHVRSITLRGCRRFTRAAALARGKHHRVCRNDRGGVGTCSHANRRTGGGIVGFRSAGRAVDCHINRDDDHAIIRLHLLAAGPA